MKKSIAAAIPVLFYSCLGILYFAVFDTGFYAKNIFNRGIVFAVPIPYVILVALFIFLYSARLKQKPRDIAYPAIAIAALLPLFYLLAELKIGMRVSNPFGGNRGIYGIFSVFYFLGLGSLFSLLSGILFRKLFKKEIRGPLRGLECEASNFVFHLPIFIFLVFVITLLFLNGFRYYAVCFFTLFLLALSSERIFTLMRKAKNIFILFARNEKLLLVLIFIGAFLLRYLWAVRLFALTGENFALASDDGLCYSGLARIISGGGLIPKERILGVSGFAYWYFLAGIYKVFGTNNFQAVFSIQAFLGAFVPVAAYFIAKKVFKSVLVSALAGILISLNMTLVFLSVVIGMEAIYIPLVLLALASAVYLLSNPEFDYKKAFCIGALFGLAYNARPPELLLFPPVLILIIYAFMRKKMNAIKIATVALFLVIGFTLLISFQYVRNYVVYGERRMIPAAARGDFREGVDTDNFAPENTMLGNMGFNPFEDPGRSFRVFLENPAAVSRLIINGFAKRLVALWFLPNFGVFNPLYLVNTASGYFFRFPVFVQCYGYIFVALGIFTSFIRKRNLSLIGVTLLVAFITYMSSRVAFFFVLNSRYRGVIMPVFLIFLAYGVALFYRQVRSAYIYGPRK
ncbi:MAG: glycosyltransferase family 39 protein [Omnitrophica bacterium]|nr:glycosyltransferase family 39 protein [Candidatus Omnitrophota bacterium]